MPESSFQHEIYAQFARIGKALSNGNRLELLEFLSQGERSVEALAKACGLTMANTSQHLQQLRQAGLVDARKAGQHVYYSLFDPAVIELLTALRNIAERSLADVDRLVKSHLSCKDNLEPVAAQSLAERMRAGLVTVIDVRPNDEYSAGHIAGARSVPLQQLAEHIDELSAAGDVVAYCRGPYCILAYEAVAQLRDRGITARRLAGGYPQWHNAGLPVERGGQESVRAVHPPVKSR